MDGRRFDDLARGLGSTSSRRSALRWAAGGIAGAVLGTLGRRADAAGCRPYGRPCERHGTCCTGFCAGVPGRRRRCTCPAGGTRCGAGCCTDGTVCRKDPGAPPYCYCPPGTEWCNGRCRDLSSNPRNCGICGVACHPGQRCVEGACGPCSTNEDCPHVPYYCTAGLCTDGVCWVVAVDCQPDRWCCKVAGDLVCVDFQSDPAHCGDCGIACGTGEVCCAGACKPAAACA